MIFSSGAKVFVGDEQDKVEEMFVLFSDPDGAVPDRVTQSMWVSRCRDAIASRKRISLGTVNENSGQVANLALLPD